MDSARLSFPITISQRALVLLMLWSLMVMILRCEPIHDLDAFWQIRVGQLMLDSGRLVTHDQFTYTHAGEPSPTFGWLAQLLFACVFRIDSWRSLQTVYAMLFSAAFIIAGSSNRCAKLSPFSVALGVMLGFESGLSNSDIRPQGIALLCFAILLALARSDLRDSLKVLFSVPILLVWQNSHPSVFVGGAVIAILGATEWGLAIHGEVEARPWGLTFLLPIIGLIQFATPSGWSILATSWLNIEIARDLLRVTEWLPPWEPTVIKAALPFWFLLAFSLVLIVRLKFEVEVKDLCIFAVMTLLALSTSRFILFWGLAMVPIWASWIERAKPVGLFAWQPDRRMEPRTFFPVMLLGGTLAFGIPSVLGCPFFSEEIPLTGIARLKQALPSGRIYNYREWGGPLILANSPAWRVAIDGRLWVFDRAQWEDYSATALGKVTIRELVRRHRPDAFFLRRGFHEPLIESLRQSTQWREFYSDELSIIFIKCIEPTVQAKETFFLSPHEERPGLGATKGYVPCPRSDGAKPSARSREHQAG